MDDDAMGELATGVAHELKQPLSAIVNYAQGCAELLSNQNPPPVDKLLGAMHKIAGNAQRACEIVRRLERYLQKAPPRRVKTDLVELVSEIVRWIEPDARSLGVGVEWEPAGRLIFADVDPIQIQQVLVTLLQNAFDEVKDQPVERRIVTVRVGVTAVVTVEVAVSDVGEGIAEDDREGVFQAFVTAKPTEPGMGLPISHAIVEEHGGKLWIESHCQLGTRFLFSLPFEVGPKLHIHPHP